eukprot:scpid70743/ scgid11526/ 
MLTEWMLLLLFVTTTSANSVHSLLLVRTPRSGRPSDARDVWGHGGRHESAHHQCKQYPDHRGFCIPCIDTCFEAFHEAAEYRRDLKETNLACGRKLPRKPENSAHKAF